MRFFLVLRVGRRRQKFLPTVRAAKVERLSVALSTPRRRVIHRHAANWIFCGHGATFRSRGAWRTIFISANITSGVAPTVNSRTQSARDRKDVFRKRPSVALCPIVEAKVNDS